MESDWDGIRITGSISAQKVDRIPFTPYTVLLMGQTGVGKSNFIEKLVGDPSLGISKDQLEGVTQEVSAFKILGLQRTWSDIYLIDVPGFADRKISEMRIVDMVRNWVDEHVSPIGMGSISYIIYIDRITDTRVPGSKRKLMAMFKEILGPRTARSVTIVTSMWDEVWTDAQLRRAEDRFNQLQGEHWKVNLTLIVSQIYTINEIHNAFIQDLIEQGARIAKFDNTQESAFSILRDLVHHSTNSKEYAGFDRAKKIRATAAGMSIYQNLLERIEAQSQRLRTIEEDLKDELTIANEELVMVLSKEKADVEADLELFKQELKDFGDAPEPKAEPQPRKSLHVREALGQTKGKIKQFWNTHWHS
ncbi:hypothetical protein CVT24_000142 [Panaeolus cyanescens]|uniref:G domain-containing protein n=1 Tax=Panaeolus cyanescens TaxID=181874 RepID=A0A409VS67_9AGAR|nr:hypothetical protein CVT24_000142 [Panaeolus cyanescens]